MDSKELVSWIKELIEGNNLKKFYNSKTIWRPVRSEALKRDNYECQECKKLGKYSEATTVHHIKHLKEYPALAITLSNLESVCYDCHNKLHPEKSFKHKGSNRMNVNEEKW